MGRLLLFLAMILGAAPAAAQTLTIDPHLDLPKSATAEDWTGLSDPTSQFDLERAKRGGLSAAAIALYVPQGPRNPASLANAQAALRARDRAIHAIVERNPTRAALALTPSDVRAIAKSGRIAVIESMLNAWPLGDDLDAFDQWYARGVRILGFVHAGHNQFADSSRPMLAWGDRIVE
ncbi:MAG TPA: membrane dipeptidase, partial [Allosphingosinicella sp.]|nr:membrane dipeptidase [Allosphingosinicella sp.]